MSEMIAYRLRRSIIFVLGGLAVSVASTASAGHYDVTHTFDFKVKNKPNRVWQGEWRGEVDTWAKDIDEGPVVDHTFGTLNWPPAATDRIDAKSVVSDCMAEAHAKVDAGGDGKGSHRIWGDAVLTGPKPVNAKAMSLSKIYKRTGTVDGRGRVRFGGWALVDSLKGKTRARDPLSFEVVNLDTGETMSSTPWDVATEVEPGSGIAWADDLLSLSGLSGGFSLQLGGPFITSAGGSVLIRFVDGEVVESFADGIFAGILPDVGTLIGGGLQIGLLNEYDIDFDFGEQNINGYEMSIGIESDAETEVPAPSPAVLLVMGVVAGTRRRR
ncbi:MAG: hypothetical protein KF787_12535 [Phycisphaeraceae bacterium]|nr:hypothetical protein [Phycisphaerae bacterium]MBX3393463.1 hypothetical protein [Phycisphaeraceae bacterium]